MTDRSCRQTAPVVFLHGTAASPRQWHDLIGRLPHAFETYTLDLPGHAAHDFRPAQRSLSQEAQSLVHRLRALGRPFHLVGHSYGGALALRIAIEWPGLVRSLTMFEPAMFHLLRDGHPIERQMHADMASLARELRRADEDGRPAEGVRRFVDFWNGPGTFDVYAPETRRKMIARMPLILAHFAALDRETWALPDCARVACPTLGVYGEASPLLAQHLTRLVAGAMTGAKVLPVAAAGHLLPVTHAAAAAKLVGAHVLAAESPAFEPRAHPGEAGPPRRKGSPPNPYAGADPHRRDLRPPILV
ncbi:MAG: alpha/beta fold hydrolase [Parvibaculaceae bacterium]